MSMKSRLSHITHDGVMSTTEDTHTFTKLALYKGALIAVRIINKPHINLNRDGLIEMRAVSIIVS